MKQIITYNSIVFVLIISLVSCKKDFLEIDPLVGSTEANFYQNEDDAIAATIACYNNLQQEVTPIQGLGGLAPHFRWYFGDVVSDDTDKGGSGDGDEPDLFKFESFQGTSDSKLVLGEWQTAYKGIAYCNIALENIPGIDMDNDVKDMLIGEIRFIRSYWYFNLATMFGGVPIIEEVLAPSEYQQERSTEEQTWSFIEEDLSQAMLSLPRRSERPLSETGRANWGAAASLLLKSYVYQKKWDVAMDVANEIYNSGEYFLDMNYANIFTTSGENGSGSIWEIQYMSGSGGNWGNQLEGTFTNVFQRARGQFGGYGFNIPTQDLVDEFEEGDPRLNASVFQVGDEMGDRGTFTLEAAGMPHLYYCKKYFNTAAEEGAALGDPNPNGLTNDRVIRYADVLLLRAEAAYHMGQQAIALEMINEVRSRARGGDLNILPEVTAGGPYLLDAIYHERRVELSLEGHRFFDIVRQNRGQQLLSDKGFISGTHELYPIPLAEISLSGGLLIQNPGY
ncbi:MAG: RagB/SusD family nutrient uptake outer membrane protein [Flavobacteriales bacterium]|jgi:starch-binding outer membrane protein, SusD/RagB family|nr:RagB/SusD family nutrient uptake outer membrane protein [Flavobacteriales bacterium]